MEYVGARIYRRPDTIEEKIIIEKSGKKERCIRRGLDLAAFSYTACTYIEFASRERATRLMTEIREGEDPWWKKCRDSSRFYAFACDIQFTKWQSPSLARSRARKKPERGERRTSNAFRAAEEIVIASDSSTHGRWKEAEARSS